MSRADQRRYRSRTTGIVHRVESEHCGVVSLVPVVGNAVVIVEVADAEIADGYTRCDIIDTYAPTCGKCGGEKFSIPGQRANLGWLCGHCDKKVPTAIKSAPTFASLQKAIERAIIACRIDANGPVIVDPANVSIEILPPGTVDRCELDRAVQEWTVTLRDTDAAIARGEGVSLPVAVALMVDKIDERYEAAMRLLEGVKP